MQAKIRIESAPAVYEINASLIADHKAKAQSKVNMDPMISAYSIVYGEIFDEAMSSPQILENWVRTSMTWDSIKENAKLVSGNKKEVVDWKNIQISYIPKPEVKKDH